MPAIKVELDKFCRNRAGKTIGPMERNPFDKDGSYPWTSPDDPYTYSDQGVWMNGQESPHDLVREL